MTRTLLAALLAVLATTGCGSFYVEAEQPQACLQLVNPQPLTLAGGGSGGQVSATIDIGLRDAIPDFVLDGNADNNVVSFLGATVVLRNAQGDAPSWLTNFKVTAVSPGAPSVVLVDYTPTSAPTSTTIALAPRERANNLVGVIQNGGLTLQLDATYASTVPPGIWTASVTACFSAKVKKTFEQLING